MALQLTLTDNKGQVSNYHRILATSQIYVGEQQGIHINLGSYTNAEYRQNETNEVSTIVSNTPIFLPFTDTDFTRANLYTRIKTEILEFADALDC